MKKITIIGGGASGSLLAANLLRHNKDETLTINLVEKKDRIGRGVAYSTTRDCHLLNVPASKMGAFPEDVEHFYKWLQEKNYAYQPNEFVPRKIYGEYLREVVCSTIVNKAPNVQINIIDDEAVDIALDEQQAQTILKSGEILFSDQVVLAFGNFLPPDPTVENQAFAHSEKYFRNPWNSEFYEKIKADEDVLIVGTGLTMVDVVLNLHASGHRGKIYALSTRGLLPAVHQLGHVYPSFYDELQTQTRITDILKIVRRHIKKAEAEGGNWRGVIDSLRPHTQEIWRNLPDAEKRYFMQHLSRYWNAARHRMPPEAAQILAEMQSRGALEITKGRLRKIEANENGKFDVSYTADGAENQLSIDAIINSIGSQSNFRKLDAPLLVNLLASGTINTDSLRLGLDALPDGRTLNKIGSISQKIFTLGTALKGILWESTAMPEIRVQANRLALDLLEQQSN